MSNVKQWVRAQTQKYTIDVKEEERDNQFIRKTWHISDPKGTGLSFSISEDDAGEPSLLDTDIFLTNRVNASEYSPVSLLNFGEQILDGIIAREKTMLLKTPLIIFQDSNSRATTAGKVPWHKYVIRKKEIDARLNQIQSGYNRKTK